MFVHPYSFDVSVELGFAKGFASKTVGSLFASPCSHHTHN